jgi:hypothetical protein
LTSGGQGLGDEGDAQRPARRQRFLRASCLDAERQRWDDHRYYHHSRINQSLHLVSALSFLVRLRAAVHRPGAGGADRLAGVDDDRQAGHFFFEPKGYDDVNQATHEYKEAIKVGYNLQRKVVLLSAVGRVAGAAVAAPSLFGLIEPAASWGAYVRDVGDVAGARRRRPALPHRAAVRAAGRADRAGRGRPRS